MLDYAMQKVSLVASLAGHEDRVWCVAVSPDGSLIASCGGDKTIRIYSLRTHGCISVLEGSHSRTIRCVTWSPSGSHIAAASFDGTVSIWEKTGTTWSSSICLEGHENEVKCVTWHRNGSLLATCARDKTVWIWEATDDGDYECAGVLNGHTQDVKCVRWHPQEELLASCSYDDTVKIWGGDGDDWSCLNTLKGHTGTVWQCSFDPTGCALASCSDDFSVRIWTRAKGAAKHNYIPSHCISGIASQPLYRCAVTFCSIARMSIPSLFCSHPQLALERHRHCGCNRRQQLSGELVCAQSVVFISLQHTIAGARA
jgi:WD40 repeat protein